jgi:hypothetical protein
VFRYTVCFHREWHELSLSFIAERIGMIRTNVSRELKIMIKDGMIREMNQGKKRYLSIGSVIESDNSSVIKNDNQEINNKKLKKDISSDFEIFWNEYPRKDAKADALRALEAALKKVDIHTILDGVRRYNNHIERERTEKKFIKLPAGWLRSERWNDYKEEVEQRSKLLRLIELHSHSGSVVIDGDPKARASTF